MIYPQFREGKRISARMHYGDLFQDRYVSIRYGRNLELLKKFLFSNDKLRVLDVGGYTADNLEFWRRNNIDTRNIDYHVVDYDRDSEKIVRNRGATWKFYDFNIDDLTKLYTANYFDLIICTEVLEHLLDPEKQLVFFKKMLKKEGRILISLPNENTIFHRIYAVLGLGIDQYAFALYKHLHFPTIKQSRIFISDHLEIIDTRFYFNFAGVGSRFGFVGKLLSKIPDPAWNILVNNSPSLLARGTVFFCKLK